MKQQVKEIAQLIIDKAYNYPPLAISTFRDSLKAVLEKELEELVKDIPEEWEENALHYLAPSDTLTLKQQVELIAKAGDEVDYIEDIEGVEV